MPLPVKILVLLVAVDAWPLQGAATEASLEVPAARQAVDLRALVPGLVQLQRGEKMKGWALIAGEAAFLAAAVEFQMSGQDLHHQSMAQLRAPALGRALASAKQLTDASAQRFRFRDGFLVAAAALWALSLVDAHVAPAPREGAAGEAALAERMLMPTVSIARRGVVAGLSLKF
jgi:hypothetical protein